MTVHVEGGNGQTLMVEGRVVLKKLVDLKDPTQWVCSIEAWNIQLHAMGSGSRRRGWLVCEQRRWTRRFWSRQPLDQFVKVNGHGMEGFTQGQLMRSKLYNSVLKAVRGDLGMSGLGHWVRLSTASMADSAMDCIEAAIAKLTSSQLILTSSCSTWISYWDRKRKIMTHLEDYIC